MISSVGSLNYAWIYWHSALASITVIKCLSTGLLLSLGLLEQHPAFLALFSALVDASGFKPTIEGCPVLKSFSMTL
jgi:hypothetical protein